MNRDDVEAERERIFARLCGWTVRESVWREGSAPAESGVTGESLFEDARQIIPLAAATIRTLQIELSVVRQTRRDYAEEVRALKSHIEDLECQIEVRAARGGDEGRGRI